MSAACAREKQRLKAAIDALKKLETGHVTIFTIEGMLGGFLPWVLSRFAEAHRGSDRYLRQYHRAIDLCGILAIGLSVVVIAGHMNLSIESVMALSAMTTVILFSSLGVGQGITFTPEWLVVPISLALALAVGAAVRAFNGLLVVRLKISAFIVTLAPASGCAAWW